MEPTEQPETWSQWFKTLPDSNTPTICTIVAKNYAAYARTLCRSFREQHPQGECFVLFIDDIEGYIDPEKEEFQVIRLDQIELPDKQVMCFWYNVTELATAVKPFFLDFLHQQQGLDSVIYLDPDIRVYAPMTEIFDRLSESEMLLTPHLDQDFPDDGHVPDDAHILRSGVYNLGFFGIRFTGNAREFLIWWKAKLHKKCVIDHGRGYFVDQRFIDLAVTLFDGFTVLHNTAVNVAYWNLHSRTVTQEGNMFRVNDAPLVFFHFSGIDISQPGQLSKHQNRIDLAQNPALRTLKYHYVEQLGLHGLDETRSWPYGFGNYTDGRAIHDLERKVFRTRFASAFAGDPFERRAHGTVFRFWVWVERLKSWLIETYRSMGT